MIGGQSLPKMPGMPSFEMPQLSMPTLSNPLASMGLPGLSSHKEKGVDPRTFLTFHSQYPRAVLAKRRAEV